MDHQTIRAKRVNPPSGEHLLVAGVFIHFRDCTSRTRAKKTWTLGIFARGTLDQESHLPFLVMATDGVGQLPLLHFPPGEDGRRAIVEALAAEAQGAIAAPLDSVIALFSMVYDK